MYGDYDSSIRMRRAEQLGITLEEYDAARADRVVENFRAGRSQHVRDVLQAATDGYDDP